MKTPISCLVTWLAVLLMGGAAPDDFVRDKDEFRYGTYDRIWKPKTVYVDTDGSLLIPVVDKLVAVRRESIDAIIAKYPDNWKNKLEFRVYIHPEARWDKIHDFVTSITRQNIGLLSLRVAMVQGQKLMTPKAELSGAGQPATQPAEKGPAEVQPPTPTSKDVPR
jgi:hypothetical protein